MLNNRSKKKRSHQSSWNVRRRWAILTLFLIGGPGLTELAAQDREKLVFAHHMGSLNAGRGAMAWHTRNPELGDPATSNGGDYRTVPLVPYDMWDLTMEETADLQIRRAMRIGIDGFAVNAWAGGEQAKEFLDALFKVAEENDYPFYISICPDANTVEQPHGLTRAWADAIGYLLDRHGDSPKLARRDGKPIIFGYQSAFVWVEYLENKYNNDRELVDIARTTPEGWALVGEAYDNLANMVGQPLYFQFDMGAFYHGLQARWAPEDGLTRAAEVVARHMPAVYEFLPSRETRGIASATVAAGAEWGHPIYMNYDNSRTPTTFGGPGTDELRKLWGEAREFDATLLQLSTWNDYHENTNVSPGTNNNYAYFDLTGYLIEWWKSGQQPEPAKDRVYVFSRKYPRWASMYPFQDYEGSDGAIEVLTILPQPARIHVPGRGEYDAPAGLFHQQFPVTPGPVGAEVIRNGVVELAVESPEPVADRPFRQDNGITGISSECDAHWREDFGDIPREYYSEYGDIDGDGLPNWFEMYWFGHFGDLSTATGANPHDDVNGDGYTNLEAYLLQRSPIAPPGSQPDQPRPEIRGPFTGTPLPVPGRVEAEHFDLGGPGAAYFDTTPFNAGGQFRPADYVDIEATTDVGGGYNVGWMASGEWINYTVAVEATGTYDIEIRVANGESIDGAIRLFMDGQDLTGNVAIPPTGGWQTWETIALTDVPLQAGERTLRVAVATGWFNLNYVDFTLKEIHDGRAPYFGSAQRFPGRVRAKHFDRGGQGVAFHDATPINEGGGYRTDEYVDLEPTVDEGGGYNLGWTAPGEWLLYTVDVERDGIYDIEVRVASIFHGATFQIEFGGADPIGIDVPNTDGWQNWETVTVPGVVLQGGVQTMRLLCNTGGFNINYVDVRSAPADPIVVSYAGWREANFSQEQMSDPSVSGDSASPSGCGIPNLLKYALNMNAGDHLGDALPEVGEIAVGDERYLTLTYTRPAGIEDVDYRVEVSGDLAGWQSGDEHVALVSSTLDGGSETIVMRDLRPMKSLTQRHIRLRVERVADHL